MPHPQMDVVVRRGAPAYAARVSDGGGFRLLFENNPVPMWVYDVATLAFLEVNVAAVAHYGYSREEFLRMRITDIRPPEEIERMNDAVAAQSADGAVLRRRGFWKHRLKDGLLQKSLPVKNIISNQNRFLRLLILILKLLGLGLLKMKQKQKVLNMAKVYFLGLRAVVP